MDSAWLTIAVSIIGGGALVEIIRGSMGRGKTAAEVIATTAEATHTDAETEKTKADTAKTIGEAWVEIVDRLEGIVTRQGEDLIGIRSENLSLKEEHREILKQLGECKERDLISARRIEELERRLGELEPKD